MFFSKRDSCSIIYQRVYGVIFPLCKGIDLTSGTLSFKVFVLAALKVIRPCFEDDSTARCSLNLFSDCGYRKRLHLFRRFPLSPFQKEISSITFLLLNLH